MWASSDSPHYTWFERDSRLAASEVPKKPRWHALHTSTLVSSELCRVQAEAGVNTGGLGCLYQMKPVGKRPNVSESRLCLSSNGLFLKM